MEDEKAVEHNKGRKAAESRGEGRADGDGPWEPCGQAGQPPQRGVPGVSTEAQELDHQRGGSDVSEVLRAPGEIGLGASPLLAAAWQPSGVGLLRGEPTKLWARSLVDW